MQQQVRSWPHWNLKDIEVVTVPQSTGKDKKPRLFVIDEKEEWRSESVRTPVRWKVDSRLWVLHHKSCMMFVRHCSWRVGQMLEQTSDQECVIRLWCCGRKSIYAFSIYNLTMWLWKHVGSRIPQLTMKDVECQGRDDYVVMSAWDPVVHSADKVMLSWW